MSSVNDYILITGSHNLDEGADDSSKTTREEDERASLQALEGQGISILDDADRPATAEPRDKLTQELLDQGGIEIIQENDGGSFL